MRRDFPRAIAEFQAGIRLNPDFFILHNWLGQTCIAAGRYADAIAAQEKAVEASRRLPYFVGSLAMAYHRSGRKAEADVLWQELEQRARSEYVPELCFAQMNAVRGKVGAVMRWVMRAAETHDSRLCWARVLPAEYLQGPADSRLKARLRKVFFGMLCNRAIARHRVVEAG